MLCDQIGGNIKSFRIKNNMTQSQLADRLCVSHQMISRYENGSPLPDIDTLIKLCEIFHVSLDCLCGLTQSDKEILIEKLFKQYEKNDFDSFGDLYTQYKAFLDEAESVRLDDRILKIQLTMLEKLHDCIENDQQHGAVNEMILKCATEILDLSREDELRSLANYRLAIYYWETPFDSPDYAKNQELSKAHVKKVLLCTYFPDYTPPVGEDPRSAQFRNTQMENLKFFEKKLYGAKKRVEKNQNQQKTKGR